MTQRFLLEALDSTLQGVMKNNLLFGGEVVILDGDLQQILLVVHRGS